tara:strand:- start:8149 stop:8403 length:255 start_codon:yes stop_codon:yes gene_type:complete
MTAKKIVLQWIDNRFKSNPLFYSFDFESSIATYGKLVHLKTHSPSTYSRAFRTIRSNNDLERRGLELEEIKSEKVSKGWIIKKL